MTNTLNVGFAGVGTVGCGAIQCLQENGPLIQRRIGTSISVTAVSGRDPDKKRAADLSEYRWETDCLALPELTELDVLVESIGGADGIAYEVVKKALISKKHVVTANKALVAVHGKELMILAAENNVSLFCDAAVAGGVPALHGIQHGLMGNRFSKITGVLNGTCNYILSTMLTENRGFQDVLTQAQDLGYAEADPSADVDGHDTAHKLAILAALCFDTVPDYHGIQLGGIAHLTLEDLKAAEEKGTRYKLVATATQETSGKITQKVEAEAVSANHPLFHVAGSDSCVIVEGDFSGPIRFQGAGAGGKPTGSAIVSDLIKIAEGITTPVFRVAS